MTKLANLEQSLLDSNCTQTDLQNAVDKLQNLSPEGLDDAMVDAGIYDRETLVEWLKNHILSYLKEGYFDYLPIQSKELSELTDPYADDWYTLDEALHIHRLTSADVEDLFDELFDQDN